MIARFCRCRLSYCLIAVVLGATVQLLSGCATAPQSARNAQALAAAHDPNALLLAGELALQQQQFLSAVKIFTAAAALSDDEQVAERATHVAFDHHQSKYVLENANRWLQLNSTSEQAHRFAGVAALRLFRIDEATQHFAALIDSAYISPQAGFVALTPEWLQEGSPWAVLSMVRQLTQREKDSAEAQYALAEAARAAENFAVAITAAKRATELSPYWIPARTVLARLQLATGDRDAAVATIKAASEQDNSSENRLEYAEILYAAGKDTEGREALAALSDVPEVAAGARRALALIDLDTGRFDEASKRWRELVQAGRFVYEGMFYLAQIEEHRGANGDAVELYTRITSGPLAVAAQARAALLKTRAGKPADGLALLQDFASAHPEDAVDTQIAAANLLADVDTVNHGIEVLTKAQADYPDNTQLRIAKALLLERGKRTREAIREMRSLLQDRPDDPSILNMLGYTLVDHTRNLQEGHDLIQRAVQMMPDNGAVLDSLGWALHKLKHNEEALRQLQRAYERARDPDIAVHLGEVQWALGREDDARDTFDKALKSFPDNAALKQALESHKIKVSGKTQ